MDEEAEATTVYVHFTNDEPCTLSPLDHGDLICIHGMRVVESFKRPSEL